MSVLDFYVTKNSHSIWLLLHLLAYPPLHCKFFQSRYLQATFHLKEDM